MPKLDDSLSLSDDDIILTNKYCTSSSNVWSVISYLWQALMLLSATVLAFQSRDVIEEMNESQHLGFMVYSQSIFLTIHIIVAALSEKTTFFPSSYKSPIMSIVLSLDIISTMMIYMGPKFYLIFKHRGLNNSNTSILPHLRPSKNKKTKQSSGKSMIKQFGLKMNEYTHDHSDSFGYMALRKAGVNVIKSKTESSNSSGYDTNSKENVTEKLLK